VHSCAGGNDLASSTFIFGTTGQRENERLHSGLRGAGLLDFGHGELEVQRMSAGMGVSKLTEGWRRWENPRRTVRGTPTEVKEATTVTA
jgi:hypothetical protein